MIMGRFILAGVIAMALSVSGTNTAKATDYSHNPAYKKVITHETITTWQTRTEAFKKFVTRYDHCGKPFQVEVVSTRQIKVPVKKVVSVVKYVKVY
jgi:hypothetical protein